MENNVNFSNDLNLEYLNLLATYGYGGEFARVYNSTSSYLAQKVDETTDLSVLDKLKRIIEYKKEMTKEGMNK